jgi:hypothetical protein
MHSGNPGTNHKNRAIGAQNENLNFPSADFLFIQIKKIKMILFSQ